MTTGQSPVLGNNALDECGKALKMARHQSSIATLDRGSLRHITSTSNHSFFVELSTFDEAGQVNWQPNPNWQRWLEQNNRFHYAGSDGYFTARREQRRNTFYWYAFGNVNGKTKKVYIGTQAAVNLANLAAVSRQFREARRGKPDPFSTPNTAHR